MQLVLVKIIGNISKTYTQIHTRTCERFQLQSQLFISADDITNKTSIKLTSQSLNSENLLFHIVNSNGYTFLTSMNKSLKINCHHFLNFSFKVIKATTVKRVTESERNSEDNKKQDFVRQMMTIDISFKLIYLHHYYRKDLAPFRAHIH